MNNKDQRVPKELLSIYEMIVCGFTQRLPQKFYFPLIWLLSKNMAFEPLGKVLSQVTDKTEWQATNDAGGLGRDESDTLPTIKDVLTVLEILKKCGYDQWLISSLGDVFPRNAYDKNDFEQGTKRIYKRSSAHMLNGFLKSTFLMIEEAFPEYIEARGYVALVDLLCDGEWINQAELAQVLAHYEGVSVNQVLDSFKENNNFPSLDDILEIRKILQLNKSHTLENWYVRSIEHQLK
jgi:hypothetical protein